MRAGVLVLLVGCGFDVGGATRDGGFDAPDAPGDGNAKLDAATDAPMATDIIIEAEATIQNAMPRTVQWVEHTDVAGYVGTGFMAADNGNGAVCPNPVTPPQDTILACAAAMFYDINVPVAAAYTFQLRMWADTSSNDSLYVTVDDGTAATAAVVDVAEDSSWHWTKNPVTSQYSLSAGTHRLGIWQREGGARIDRLALTAGPALLP